MILRDCTPGDIVRFAAPCVYGGSMLAQTFAAGVEARVCWITGSGTTFVEPRLGDGWGVMVSVSGEAEVVVIGSRLASRQVDDAEVVDPLARSVSADAPLFSPPPAQADAAVNARNGRRSAERRTS